MSNKSMERCVLAVESGGTKCDALLVRDNGTVLGWGHHSYADPGSGRGISGSGRSEETILAAIKQATQGIECDELHVVGSSFSTLKKLIDRGLICAAEHTGVGESAAAFSLAGIDSGIAVIIGTGALVHGRNRSGEVLSLDGLGPQLGDYGSGYHIGSLAIRAAARSSWHPRRHTSLTRIVYRECIGDDSDNGGWDLVRYMLETHDRAEIAHLARFVDEEANAGDQIAIEILHEAASAATETVHDLFDRLNMADEDYVMAGVGGVPRRSHIYWEHLRARVKEFAPRLKPVLPQAPPVVGLALIVLHKLGAADPDILRERLFEAAKNR